MTKGLSLADVVTEYIYDGKRVILTIFAIEKITFASRNSHQAAVLISGPLAQPPHYPVDGALRQDEDFRNASG
jgi:hypothetical protein